MNNTIETILSNIDKTYSDPVIYAASMHNYLINKTAAINKYRQNLVDITMAVDSNGKYYNICQLVDLVRANNELPNESTDICEGGKFHVQSYDNLQYDTFTDDDLHFFPNNISEFSPTELEIYQKLKDLGAGSIATGDTFTAASEWIFALSAMRDGKVSEPMIPTLMKDNFVKCSEVSENFDKMVGDFSTLAIACKNIALQGATQISEKVDSFKDIIAEFDIGTWSAQLNVSLSDEFKTISSGCVDVVTGLLQTTGSIKDKITSITNIIKNGINSFSSNSANSNTTGFARSTFDYSGYDMTNASTAFATAKTTIFSQLVQGVKTFCLNVGSLAKGLIDKGVSVCKKLYSKYIDPLVTNGIFEVNTSGDSANMDLPTYSVAIPFKSLYDLDDNLHPSIDGSIVYQNRYDNAEDKHVVSDFSTTSFKKAARSLFQDLTSYNEVITDIFLNESIFENDQAIHMKYAWGDWIIFLDRNTNADQPFCIMEFYPALTTPIYSLPVLLFNFVYPNSSTYNAHFSKDVYLYEDRTSIAYRNNFDSLLDYIKSLFGLGDNLEVINPFSVNDLDIHSPRSVAFSAYCSTIRMLGYFTLRSLWSANIDRDYLITNTFQDLMTNDNLVLPNERWYCALFFSSIGIPVLAELKQVTSAGTVYTRYNSFLMQNFVEYSVDQALPTNIYAPFYYDYLHDCWVTVSLLKQTWTYLYTQNRLYNILKRGKGLYTDQDVADWIRSRFMLYYMDLFEGITEETAGTDTYLLFCCLTPPDSRCYTNVSIYTRDTRNSSIINPVQWSGIYGPGLVLLFDIMLTHKIAMEHVYSKYGVFPTFIPYEMISDKPVFKYHVKSTTDIINKAVNMKNIVSLIGVTLVTAAATVAVKVILQKKGRAKLTTLASNTETMRYLVQTVSECYSTKKVCEFGVKRIPTKWDVDNINLYDDEYRSNIIKSFNKLKFFDFSVALSSVPQEYIDEAEGNQIPQSIDVQNYNQYYTKSQKRANLLSKVIKTVTGATSDYADYIDLTDDEPDPLITSETDLTPTDELIESVRNLIYSA